MTWVDLLYEDYLFYCFEKDSDTASYEEFSTFELLITKKDGTKALYNSLERAARRIVPEEQDILKMSKEKYMMEFGWRMTSLMNCKGVTTDDLVERTGISKNALYSYSRGDKLPNIHAAILIADALGCSLDEFRKIPK